MLPIRSIAMAVVLFGAACADEPTRPDPVIPPVDQGISAFVTVDNLHALPGQTVRVSVLSSPSARSDHHIALPECGSVGRSLVWRVPSKCSFIAARGSSTYRAAYSCVLVATVLPRVTRS